MQEGCVRALPHNAAESGHQIRSSGAQFVVMMNCHLAQNLLTLGSQREQNFAAIVGGAGAMDEAPGFEAVN